jgi:hypothetical protein
MAKTIGSASTLVLLHFETHWQDDRRRQEFDPEEHSPEPIVSRILIARPGVLNSVA